ncbi:MULTISPECIES: hypothetical protein [Methylomonas]|uniref:Uncharacterized protein n=1 Tax=Methylomonas koyamae TaxID=702114 RepID=A0A177NY34_9GAMM|nr:hypothetical protein [Methylomonas koyamae]OAI22987.1 hypothetical protein A1355_22130 [Methylomonas koyamae]
METLFDIALLAIAAYAARAYLLLPETVQDRDIFPSRAATFVTRLVREQNLRDVPADRAKPISIAGSAAEADAEADAVEIVENPAAELTTAIEEAALVETPAEPATVAADVETMAEAALRVPEDSILSRHYFAQLAAEKAALANPYPTESVLRRHYRQRLAALLDLQPLGAESASDLNGTEASLEFADSSASLELAEGGERIASDADSGVSSSVVVPTDSVLRRHVLAQLQRQLEAEWPDSPTDSVLKRHRQQWLDAKIAAQLGE